MHRRHYLCHCLAGLLLLLLATAWADPPEVRAGLDTLEDLVGQLIRVQQATHAARSEWQDQEAQLKREEELLRQRLAGAAERLKTVAAEREKAGTERQAATQAASKAEGNLARYFAPIAAAEARLRELRPRLPPLLMENQAAEFAKLPPADRPVGQADAGERLRLVLALTTEIEQFDASIHAGRLILSPPDGQAREMDVLQLGLGTAFAVAADGSQAAMGRPGAEAWQWEWRADLAEPIRIALQVYHKQRPAEFVSLPLQLGRVQP